MNEEMDYSFCKPYITAGEHILWRGTPGSGNLLTRSDVFLIPFSIFWCGGVTFAAANVLTTDAPVFAKLFMIPFLCAGFYILIGRFLVTALSRKNTAYVITNQKIIRKRGSRIDIQALANAPATHLELHKNGYGTITFGTMYNNAWSGQSRSGTADSLFVLENIPDPVRVQQIILNAVQ